MKSVLVCALFFIAMSAFADDSEVKLNPTNFNMCDNAPTFSIPKYMVGVWTFLLPSGSDYRTETMVISENGDIAVTPEVHDDSIWGNGTCVMMEIEKNDPSYELSLTWKNLGYSLRSEYVQKAVVRFAFNRRTASTAKSSAHSLSGPNLDLPSKANFYNPQISFARPLQTTLNAAASISPDKTE